MVSGLNIIGSNKALQDHWIKRIVAFIIDVIIVWVVSIVLVILLLSATWTVGGFGSLFLGLGTVMVGLVGILYWILQEGFWGATIGKKAMRLQVVGTTGPVDVVKATIRNISKFHWVLLLIDWIAGIAMEGDPRQKITDRLAGTTVVRTDAQAYMEEQFRQMATPPPHPVAPGQGYVPPAWTPPYTPPTQQSQQPQAYQQAATIPPGAPAQAPVYQPPPQQTVPPGGWPQQQAPPAQRQQTGAWPQHQWNEQGQLVQPKFCSNCGGTLVPRGDGRHVCTRCGMVY